MPLLGATIMTLMSGHISFHSTCAMGASAKSSPRLLLYLPSPSVPPPSNAYSRQVTQFFFLLVISMATDKASTLHAVIVTAWLENTEVTETWGLSLTYLKPKNVRYVNVVTACSENRFNYWSSFLRGRCFASQCPKTPPLLSVRLVGGLVIRLEVTWCYTLHLLPITRAPTPQLHLGMVNNIMPSRRSVEGS